VVIMAKSNDVRRHAAANPPRRRRSTPASPTHPLLVLQQQAGNRAVTAGLRGPSLGPQGLLMLGHQASNRAALATVQREGEQGAGPAEAADQDGGGQQIEAEVERQVRALPDVDEAAVAAPQQVEAANEEQAAARSELGELGLTRNRALAQWYGQELGGEAAVAPPAVEELQAARDEADLPAPARPGRAARAKAALSSGANWLGGKFGSAATSLRGAASRAAGWFKSTFSREGRHDAGGKGQAVVGLGAPVAGHAHDVLTATQDVVDNPVTAGTAHLVGGSTAAAQVHQAGEAVGGVGSAGQASGATLEHPAEFARSFTSGGFEAAHAVASVVGVFFSAIKAALDIRSLLSTVQVIRGLKQARQSATAWGSSPAIVEAVDYAIRQKYEKLIKRAIGSMVALAALGTGLALLIANPVGASLAAVIIGGIGAGVFLYKLGRWAWKKWKTESLGEKRQKMAARLYAQMRARDALALEAVRSLHLVPAKLEAAPDGAALIARKLKSA
jgi:hypothetical protein